MHASSHASRSLSQSFVTACPGPAHVLIYPVTALERTCGHPSPAITLVSVKTSAHAIQPSRKQFLALASEHTLVPVCRILAADLETPVSAFLRAAWPERECFLLESVEGGEQVGRYTFIGLTPFKRIVARGSNIVITEGKKVVELEGDVFDVLRRALGGHKPARLPGLPPFTAGAVGFLAYDAVRQIERAPSTTYARRSGWWSRQT